MTNTYCTSSHSLLSERLAREKNAALEQAGTKIDAVMPNYLPPCFWTSYAFAGIDHGIGHFMLFEVDSAARAPAPPLPKSPQTSSAASDRKNALLPSSRQAG